MCDGGGTVLLLGLCVCVLTACVLVPLHMLSVVVCPCTLALLSGIRCQVQCLKHKASTT